MCEHCHEIKDTKKKKKYLTEYKELMEEYDWEANEGLDPSKLTHGMQKKIGWKDKYGHKWTASIFSRTHGSKCPYCTNKKVLEGFNDLATVYPEIAKEWDNNKNEIKPTEVICNSRFNAWWICSENPEHKWKTKVCNRTVRNTRCPYCSKLKRASTPEYIIEYYLCKLGLKVRHSYMLFGFELDLYIPDLNIGIEYDGYYWHKNKEEQDIEKNRKCKELNIKLYRIRESLDSLNSTSIDIFYDHKKEKLDIPIKRLIDYISPNNSLNININKDMSYIYKNMNDHYLKYEIGDIISEQWKIIKIYDDKLYAESRIYNLYDFECIKCGFIKKKSTIHNVVKTNGCHHINMWPSKRLRAIYHKMKKRYNRNKLDDEQRTIIYDEWIQIPMSFIKWSLDNGYNDNLFLNKIDKSKGFSPDNCIWSDKRVITRAVLNKESEYELNGEVKTLTEWAMCFGLQRGYFFNYLYRYGKDYIKVILEQVYNEYRKYGKVINKSKKYIKIKDKIMTYSECSTYIGHNKSYVSQYIRVHGLEKSIEHFTLLYEEKQKQESTQKNNIAA